MNIKRHLMPGFLKKAEQKLLLNNPGIWSTRIHLVLYYGVLFILFLTVLSFLEPTDLRDDTLTHYWISFAAIISGIGLTGWLIYLLRFNVFKKYGNVRPLYGLVTFALYFIATGVIDLFPCVHPVVESIRANMAYAEEEIVHDVNSMNLKLCQLEYPLLQKKWDYETVAYVKSLNRTEPTGPEYYDDTVATPSDIPTGGNPFYRLDSANFYNRLSSADSVVRINDTVYQVYETPSFKFVYTYNSESDINGKEQLLTSFELFKAIYGHPPAPAAREKISKELNALLQKYYFYSSHKDEREEVTAQQIDEDDDPFEVVDKKYRLKNISASISNIIDKKYRWESSTVKKVARSFYYVTLTISLLIFIFRHSTIRTFFLSLLAGVLLAIITALIFSFAQIEKTTGLAWIVAYTFLLFIGSLAAWQNKKRKVVTGIMINLFVFIVTALPLLIVGWCYEIAKNRHLKKEDYSPFDPEGVWNHYFLIAEIGGILLLLILLATYIGNLYRRWYSLPEN